jgi:hypothetical protein
VRCRRANRDDPDDLQVREQPFNASREHRRSRPALA